ncbi:MAG: hypothetical protein ACE5K4_00650 [Candidatus Hydrothermarchaeota archaeon]
MTIHIEYDGEGLNIYDTIEGKFTILRCNEFKFTENHFGFKYPVDITFSGFCKEVRYENFLTFVRNYDTYEIVRQIENSAFFTLPKNKYIIEINSHVKIYAFLDSEIKIKSRKIEECTEISLEFDKEREIIFGVRSYHKRPEFTIKVTKDLKDIANAISLFSSSIKTNTCERSYPTLRGHPPLIEFSDRFEAPDNLEKPSSGVEIFIPEKLEYIYTVAPLAYYLLADIRFGVPRIVSNDFEYRLPEFPEFENEVNWILQKIFFLDCLVRNAGLYKVNLNESEVLNDIDLDIDKLYYKSIEKQLPVYLDVPDEKIKSYMPKWHLSSYVKPRLENLRSIPFLLNNLSLIYLPRYEPISEREIIKMSLQKFFRGDLLDSSSRRVGKPHLKEAQNHLWLSEEVVIDCAKSSEEAFFNQIRYNGKKKKKIKIALVLNDHKMLEEMELVKSIYRKRKDIPLKTNIYDFLSKDDLSDLFAHGFDLIHYIGHCDDGFVCSDGSLRAKDIEENNTPAFFLNACRSYEEGEGLIKKGSVAGIVTLFSVCNEAALKIGYNFSRLLSAGFSIGKAMELARLTSVYGRDYLVLGNSEYHLMQNPSFNLSFIYELEDLGEDINVGVKASDFLGIGSFFYPYINENNKFYLIGNKARFKTKKKTLIKMISSKMAPLIYKDKLYWTDEAEKIIKV